MNLKTGFVLYSLVTEVAQESCPKICFVTVGTLGEKERTHQNPQTRRTYHPKNPCTITV